MTDVAGTEEIPKVRIALVGRDGNAMSLLSAWRNAAREQVWKEAAIDAVSDRAMAGDYHHLLATLTDHSDPRTVFGDGDEVWEDDADA